MGAWLWEIEIEIRDMGFPKLLDFWLDNGNILNPAS